MDINEIAKWRVSAARQIAIEDYKLHSDEALERLRYQVEYSQSALKNLQLVNGGGIIALLTFVGNVPDALDKNSLFWAFVWFSLGLASALVSYLGAYFSQSEFMNACFNQAWEAQHKAQGSELKFEYEPHIRKGNKALWLAIILAITSMIGFVTGALVAIEGLR